MGRSDARVVTWEQLIVPWSQASVMHGVSMCVCNNTFRGYKITWRRAGMVTVVRATWPAWGAADASLPAGIQ